MWYITACSSGSIVDVAISSANKGRSNKETSHAVLVVMAVVVVITVGVVVVTEMSLGSEHAPRPGHVRVSTPVMVVVVVRLSTPGTVRGGCKQALLQ